MDRYARIADRIVVEIVELPAGSHPGEIYHPDIAGTLIPCASAETGWRYDGKKFTEPAVDQSVILPAPDDISRRQFFQHLAGLDIITRPEALAAMDGAIPSPLQKIIDQMPGADERFAAMMLVKGAQVFSRLNPLAESVCAAMKWSPDQRDDFWRGAASL